MLQLLLVLAVQGALYRGPAGALGPEGAKTLARTVRKEQLDEQASLAERSEDSPLNAGDWMFGDVECGGEGQTTCEELDQKAAKIIIDEDFKAGEEKAKNFQLNSELDMAATMKQAKGSFSTYYWLNEWRMDQSYARSSYYGYETDTGKKDPVNMIWQDDKIDQVCVVEGWTEPRTVYPERHGELHKRDATVEKRAELVKSLMSKAEGGARFVLKATNGANSQAIFPFCGGVPEAQKVSEAVDACLAAVADRAENWQIQMVLPGVVAESCYDSGVALNEYWGRKPMELKVVSAWGKVQGATLETHPSIYWIRANGAIYKWRTQQGYTLYWRNKQAAAGPLSNEALETLEKVLQASWGQIVTDTELIAKKAGNDELRVDWFVGGADGVKLNEVTYMGGAQRYPSDIQTGMKDSFVNGYVSRKTCKEEPATCKTVPIPAKCHNYADEKLDLVLNRRHRLGFGLWTGGIILLVLAVGVGGFFVQRRRRRA